MEIQEVKNGRKAKNKRTTIGEYLIRKYGREPRITEKEMKENQWKWH